MIAANKLMCEIERVDDHALAGRQSVLKNELLRAFWRRLQRPGVRDAARSDSSGRRRLPRL
jgi:hypothetical protein